MFTGIIQSTGEIVSIESRGDALTMRLKSPGFFKNCKLGDSVANDGVCLSIESCTDDEATFCLMHQTVENTGFKQAAVGKLVNLELPCRADSFMGGHFVMGHVDCITEVIQVTPRETGVEVDLKLPADLRRYVIRRGSISLNGISLTVAEKFEESIRVCIIPETLARTNLRNWVPGTIVNVEVDMLGKYIENYPVINVYTKPGLTENTYVAYVCSEVKFTDVNKNLPGMQTYYIGMNENGEYFINDGTYDEAIKEYIKTVTLQDDVVDLNNKIVVEYNDLLAEDEELSEFIAYLKEKINEDVGEILAAAEKPETEEGSEETESETEVAEETQSVIKTVRTTDVVNIRSSDSEEADNIDKAQIGDEFTLLEERGNGWSKIEFEGKEELEHTFTSVEETVTVRVPVVNFGSINNPCLMLFGLDAEGKKYSYIADMIESEGYYIVKDVVNASMLIEVKDDGSRIIKPIQLQAVVSEQENGACNEAIKTGENAYNSIAMDFKYFKK